MIDDHTSRRRREAIASRALLWRLQRAVWWATSDILEAIQPEWLKLPPEKFYGELLDAMGAGTFDRGGKTRVALLSPHSSTALETRWPRVRLTSERARRIV